MDADTSTGRHLGAQLMTVGGALFVGYGIYSLLRTVLGIRYEVGVESLAESTAPDPALFDYLDHLHVAFSGFMIATGIAVVSLAWYGVRRGYPWAWSTAVLTATVALVTAIPVHFGAAFDYDHLIHLGPLYLAAVAFAAGAAVSGRALHWQARTPEDDNVET
ncbi:hypothetical protein [Halostella sp. PRR32]|uniref:hypothetical protein n=1 Tax=Halostella sp. PRR32 TaxID=3098147 RepID=UPI002B1D96C2|nr:hypothetical protein [Halostella sp. PRR32]